MLDRKTIVENVELIKENCRRRGVQCEVDRLVEIEALRRVKLQEAQELNRQANEVSKQIGGAKTPEDREKLKEQGRLLREQKDAAQAEYDRLDGEAHALQVHIPNLTHPAAPIGGDDTANTEIARGKTPIPKFDFKAKDHLELGKLHDLIDFEGGARVAGAGFYFLKNEAVLLELALQQFAVHTLLKHGFARSRRPT